MSTRLVLRANLILCCAVILAWGAPGYAANLYVNNTITCSDATNKASNSVGSPWCTIYRAAKGAAPGNADSASEAAAAGDTVYITAGTYDTTGTGLRDTPAYNPVNSGTSGNPITFRANGGTVTLTETTTAGPMIGAGNVDYIAWIGPFSLSEPAVTPRVSDTGLVAFWGTTGSSIDRCTIDRGAVLTTDSNHVGVRIENSVSVTVKNCEIHNVTVTGGAHVSNGAGVQVYGSKGLTIEHNTIYDVGTGVYFKAIGFIGDVATPSEYSDMQDVVRYNKIYNATYGLLHMRHYHTASTVYVLWYQNLIYNTTNGIRLWSFPDDGPSNGRFVNNTVDATTRGIDSGPDPMLATQNALFQNNLITNSSGHAVLNGTTTTAFYDLPTITFTRNWYWTYGNFHYDYGGSNRTFAYVQSTYTGQEANSTNGTDPSYVNAAAYNYKLSGGSSALTAGRVVHSIGGTNGDTIPVGAYITGDETIGVELSGTTPSSISGSGRFVGNVVIR